MVFGASFDVIWSQKVTALDFSVVPSVTNLTLLFWIELNGSFPKMSSFMGLREVEHRQKWQKPIFPSPQNWTIAYNFRKAQDFGLIFALSKRTLCLKKSVLMPQTRHKEQDTKWDNFPMLENCTAMATYSHKLKPLTQLWHYKSVYVVSFHNVPFFAPLRGVDHCQIAKKSIPSSQSTTSWKSEFREEGKEMPFACRAHHSSQGWVRQWDNYLQ